MKPSEFESFWAKLSRAQGDDLSPSAEQVRSFQPLDDSALVSYGAEEQRFQSAVTNAVHPSAEVTAGDEISATVITKDGLTVHVSGSPTAMASFLRH